MERLRVGVTKIQSPQGGGNAVELNQQDVVGQVHPAYGDVLSQRISLASIMHMPH